MTKLAFNVTKLRGAAQSITKMHWGEMDAYNVSIMTEICIVMIGGSNRTTLKRIYFVYQPAMNE